MRLLSEEGAEHKVFLWQDQRVVKYTWPGTFGFIPKMEQGRFSTDFATPEDYLWRIWLQNIVFNDEVGVEGIVQLPREKGLIQDDSLGWTIVTSQPFRKGNPATEEAIRVFMEENDFRKAPGFHKAPPLHTWYRAGDGLLVSDAHLGNFIDSGSSLFPIDLHLNQVPRAALVEAGWLE